MLSTKRCVVFVTAMVFSIFPVFNAWSEIELRTIMNVKTDGTPIDVAMPSNALTTFVLTDKAEVLVLSSEGKLLERIKLEDPADSIAVTPGGEAIILSSREDKTVRIILVEFIKEIDTSRAPFKGVENAPIVIAVFSDFQ